MTRGEAIKVLNMVEAHGLADEAKRMAIEALQREEAEAKGYCHRIKPKQDLISRAGLFNKLATVQAPPEANEYKAEVYKIIQSMGTEENEMTRQEAINTLKKLYATFDAIHETTDFEDGREEMEALDLAIEALKKLDRGYIDKGLLMFLALAFPAPEEAPNDWFHHGDENLDAWRAYIMKCKERGYYDIPMIDGQAYWQTEDGKPSKAEYSVYCSKCGSWSEYRTKYCGNCGSLMKEENDDK